MAPSTVMLTTLAEVAAIIGNALRVFCMDASETGAALNLLVVMTNR